MDFVLCVPGHWTTRSEVFDRLAAAGCAVEGNNFRLDEYPESFEVEMESNDNRMLEAFRGSGGSWLTDADEAAIKAHSYVAYIIGEAGSPKLAESALHAGAALVKAGGFAIKVENSGAAHSAEHWLQFASDSYLLTAHNAFVLYVVGEQAYSCGMHILGLPDAIVQSGESKDPVELLRVFTRYLFAERPEVASGQTFSTGPAAPLYLLSREKCDLYDGDALFTNPNGMWRLALA